jgi:hypothetical protein
LLGLFIVLFICNGPCVFAQTTQTDLKLQEAHHTFEQAFNTVLDAENVHANITSLLSQLNNVAEILSQAENARRSGNNALAITNADSVIQGSKQILSNAQTLKESALIEKQNALWIRNISIIIGSIIFILIMFIVWRQFKRHYVNKKLEEKPGVTN